MIDILVGMISSGKSTYCKNITSPNFICVNDDRIVELVHGGDYTKYDEELKLMYKGIENLIITMGLFAGKTIVIDRGLNISKNGRQRFLSLAKSFDVKCRAIIFQNQGPKFHALRRFESDNRGHDYNYWLRVANHHDSIWETPTLEEGFSEIIHI